MSIELYPSIAKIKRNGVYENLPGFVPETGSVATQQMIATAESSATAQYVHNKGEYFRLNDTLYQAIVKINVGDAIVVGTNCEVAVLGNDVTHIANSIAEYELGIATSSHNTGDYFMVNEAMYVATADIQVGDNISTSTNCRLAVVGDELSGLKTAVTLNSNSTNIFDGNKDNGGYIGANGRYTYSSGMAYTQSYIPVNEGDVLSVGASNCTPYTITHVAAYDSSKTVVAASGTDTASINYTVPSGIAFVRISTSRSALGSATARINKSDRLLPYEPYFIDALAQKEFSIKASNNYIIPEEIQTHSGKFMRVDGTTGNDAKYSYTQYIPVHEGDVVYCVQDGKNGGGTTTTNYNRFRFVTAFDSTLTAVSASGTTDAYSYTVPSGITYIICTIWKSAYEEGKLAININSVLPYEPYYNKTMVDGLQELSRDVEKNTNDISWLKTAPFTTLPSSFVGNMYYKPLGQLTKPYICLVSDDGKAGLNTYTIPMILEKEVPCTFAIMSSSEVMQTAEDIAIVKDAVDNGGCSIAQHGGVNWTEYTEEALNAFFDSEAAFFESVELPVTSAVIPSHYNSKLISATAGGRYGVVRSGIGGHFEPTIYYGNFLAGARSNIYMLPSYNITLPETLAANKDIIDYAITNNLIAIIYWHEVSLTAEDKTMLEGLIDYAKTQDITFINLGDIATKKVI